MKGPRASAHKLDRVCGGAWEPGVGGGYPGGGASTQPSYRVTSPCLHALKREAGNALGAPCQTRESLLPQPVASGSYYEYYYRLK